MYLWPFGISAGNVSNPLLRVHHCSQIASIFGKKGDKKEKMNEWKKERELDWERKKDFKVGFKSDTFAPLNLCCNFLNKNYIDVCPNQIDHPVCIFKWESDGLMIHLSSDWDHEEDIKTENSHFFRDQSFKTFRRLFGLIKAKL